MSPTCHIYWGIEREDIVLAFHDTETRKLTEFAVA